MVSFFFVYKIIDFYFYKLMMKIDNFVYKEEISYWIIVLFLYIWLYLLMRVIVVN